MFFIFGSATLTGYTSNINLNSSSLTGGEIDTGGLFGTGVSFGRFFAFVGFGIGLPADTPSSIQIIFFFIQTIISILAIGFIISSIWSG